MENGMKNGFHSKEADKVNNMTQRNKIKEKYNMKRRNKKMKKTAKRVLAMLLVGMMLLSMTACGGKKEKGKVKVNFWATVNMENQDAYQKLVDDFNAAHPEAQIVLVPQTDGYASGLSQVLRGNNPPDILILQEREFHTYGLEHLLTNLDEYIANDTNENFNMDDMWAGALMNYSMNIETGYTNTGDNYYGIPCGFSPTVLFYNTDMFAEQKINMISVAEDELDSYNDKKGTTILPHGYYVYDTAPADGMTARNDGKYHVFNNRIAMNWEETVALSKIFTKSHNAESPSSYGLFNEWWFQHGWSVGGDCVEWDAKNEKYFFSLGDETANYLVTGKNGVTVNGTKYQEGDLLSYDDKKYVAEHASDSKVKQYLSDETLYRLPSMRDAFKEFLKHSFSTKAEVENGEKGYGISPSPATIGDTSKNGLFTTGEVAMMVNTFGVSDEITDTMEKLGKKYDVAPVYQYREYNSDGTAKEVNGTKIYGKLATNGSSVAYVIPENSTHKDIAWQFISFVTGTEGQKILEDVQSSLPTQKSLAQEETFINQYANKMPNNIQAVIDLAENASVGDWCYMENGEWIGTWSNVLNTDLRNGKITLKEFFKDEDVLKTDKILEKYKLKRNK